MRCPQDLRVWGFSQYFLGPAKTYTLRGTPRTYAIKVQGL